MEGASAGEKTTLVTLGPLTNIALLLKAYPQVKEHIERIGVRPGYYSDREDAVITTSAPTSPGA